MNQESITMQNLLERPKTSQIKEIISQTTYFNENVRFLNCYENLVNLKLTESSLVLQVNEHNKTEIFLLPLSLQLHFNIIYEEPVQSKVIKCFQLKYKNIPICQFMPLTSEKHYQTTKIFRRRLISSGYDNFFKTIQKIGYGAFAQVYVVKKYTRKRNFAAKLFPKVLDDQKFKNQRIKQAIINELNLLRMFNHKRIPTLHGAYAAGNSIVAIMEYVQGHELRNFLVHHKYSQYEVKIFMSRMLKTLKYLRKLRIVHRDISPRNIMIQGDKLEDMFLVDFGFATPCDVSEYIFTSCGTPGYIAPELFNFHLNSHAKIEPSSDIFSAGVIFYEVITRSPLIIGNSENQIKEANKLFNEQYLQKRMNNNNLSQSVKDLLLSMLKIEPKGRINAEEALHHPFFLEQSKNLEVSKK